MSIVSFDTPNCEHLEGKILWLNGHLLQGYKPKEEKFAQNGKGLAKFNSENL